MDFKARMALVLGDEPLLGVIPLEAMDMVIDPRRQEVMVNPKHPNFPVYPVKSVASERLGRDKHRRRCEPGPMTVVAAIS